MKIEFNDLKNSASVIIPAYNVETCLARAIFSALNQIPSPHEVIVINDGSTDGTAAVAMGFGEKIRYIEQTNQGPAAARNKGLASTTGKYISFLDADDYWLPGFLHATVGFLEKCPDAVAVSTGWEIQPLKGSVKTFPSSMNKNEIQKQPIILDCFFSFWGRYDHVRTGTVLIRRSLLGNETFQRTDLRICEDLEFWGYLATIGTWGFIPDAYWFGDSARIAAQNGWLKKYHSRRKHCPTVEIWQQRIIPKLKDKDKSGFKLMRGRVASSYLQNTILGGKCNEAREIIKAYGKEMPDSWLVRLMKLGHSFGKIGWSFACIMIYFREYQKSIALYFTSKSSEKKIKA